MSASCVSNVFERESRQEWLKHRFAGIISKSQKVLDDQKAVCCSVKKSSSTKRVATIEKMRMRRQELEIENKTLRRKAEIQKRREPARSEIEKMSNTTGIGENQEVMREFEELIGCNKQSVENHVSMTPYGSNSLFVEFVDVTDLKGSHCWKKYKESFCQMKSTNDKCRVRAQNVTYAKKADNVAKNVAVKKVGKGEVIDCCRHVKNAVVKELKEGKIADCRGQNDYELEEGEIID